MRASFAATFLCLLIVTSVDRADLWAQAPLQRVAIAYSSTGVNYVDLFLGKEKGYFREEGLEPQLIQMSSNLAITASIAGELDGQAAIGSAIRAIQRGAPSAGRSRDLAPSSVLARGPARVPGS